MADRHLRIAFMGSPDFSVGVLKALMDAGHEIACVYSQPPRKAGRGKTLRPTPVHAFADEAGLKVRTPRSLKTEAAQAEFAALELDAAVVVAYGLILPQAVLNAPRLGCMNMHASLLPRWRGAAPIQRAIMAGDRETGVDAMVMEAGLDTGPVIARARTKIDEDDTAGSLHDRLAALAADLAPQALAGLYSGALVPEAQSEEGVTYAHKITAADCGIDWGRSAEAIRNQIRGLAPQPGAFCYWQAGEDGPQMRLKILAGEVVEAADDGRAGEVLDDALTIKCGEGALRLTRLQKPGGKPVTGEDFLRGMPIAAGARLGSVPCIREANAGDAAAITALNDAAFGGADESRVVAQLSRDGDTLFSLVAECEGEIVGHLELFRIAVDGEDIAAGLGPMSVAPVMQGSGIGSELVGEAIRRVRKMPRKILFVLGHLDYYPRFGFSAELAAPFDVAWAGPHFMAIALRKDAPSKGVLTYPPVFMAESDADL